MDNHDIQRLAREARRDDYHSMIRLARALYAAGADEREVARRCYGVDLPEEYFLFIEDEAFYDEEVDEAGTTWSSPFVLTNLPLQLLIPDGLEPEPFSPWREEVHVYAFDPDLVPILFQRESYRSGYYVDCYRITELREGRSTVFRFDVDPTREPVVTRLADSEVSLMVEGFRETARRAEEEWHHAGNRGAGSIDRHEVERAHAWVDRVERIQRRIANR